MIPPAPPPATAFRDLLPAPVAVLQGRRGSGMSVELYRLRDADLLARHDEHLVSIQMASADLYQRRGSREAQRRLMPGDVIVTPAGGPKAWRRRGAGELLVIAIAPRLLDDLLQEAGADPSAHAVLLDNFGTRDPDIVEIGVALRRELDNRELGGALFVEAAVRQLGVRLLRGYCAPHVGHEPAVRMSAHKLRTTRAYVQDHLAGDLSVRALARNVGMSEFHFAHAFRATTGLPPHRYVLEQRMGHAKALLRDSELPLADIAARVGFSSQSHFSVAFHRHAGITAREFRRQR